MHQHNRHTEKLKPTPQFSVYSALVAQVAVTSSPACITLDCYSFVCLCLSISTCARLQSFWQMRRFRGRRTWFSGGKMRRLSGKQRGRRGDHGLLTNRAKSSPLWWRRTTKHTTNPTLTFAASGFVSLCSLFDQYLLSFGLWLYEFGSSLIIGAQ